MDRPLDEVISDRQVVEACSPSLSEVLSRLTDLHCRDAVIGVEEVAVLASTLARTLERFFHLIPPRPHDYPSCATASPAILERRINRCFAYNTSAKADYKDLDNEWVHDRYDDDPEARAPARAPQYSRKDRYSPDIALAAPGAKLRVDNLHYDLTEEDLEGLFTRIGPVNSLALRFDRAGRSSGTAFVTYHHISDARMAIREFDGANAHGQPIRLTLLPTAPANDIRGRGPVPARNPFDTVERPARSLFDRIDDPRFGSRSRNRGGRSRSRSPGKPRRSDVSRPAPEGVDRYVPPSGRGLSRMRSRSPRRGGGDFGGRGRGRGGEKRGGGRESAGMRPRKTQEELDKEMEDYWGPSGQPNGVAASAGMPNGATTTMAAPVVVGDDDEDIDMGID